MAHLELKLIEGGQKPYIKFLVDGDDLGAPIKAALPEILPFDGIGYSMLDTVLGEEARMKGAKGAILFACNCGCFACSGVTADVQVTDSTIAFSNFRTCNGEWPSPLDPVSFDRGQFEEAVARLMSEIEAWQPPPVGPKM